MTKSSFVAEVTFKPIIKNRRDLPVDGFIDEKKIF